MFADEKERRCEDGGGGRNVESVMRITSGTNNVALFRIRIWSFQFQFLYRVLCFSGSK